MLESMRKHAKYFYVLFGIIILAFVIPYNVYQSSPQVAEIGKERITHEEYNKAYNMERDFLSRQYKEKFDEEFEKKIMLKQVVLNRMIDKKILLLAAKEMGISVSDEELGEVITKTGKHEDYGKRY
jgi:parvulin-like peptidyl-prolyl isomerase